MKNKLHPNEEKLLRMVSDFFDKCPYCNTHTLSRQVMDPPMHSLLCEQPPHTTDVFCTSCNRQMTHLHWRGYKVNWSKRYPGRNFPRSDLGILEQITKIPF